MGYSKNYPNGKCGETIENLSTLLLDVWKLPRPNLIISIIGGRNTFSAAPILQYRIRRGIVRAAQSTGIIEYAYFHR